MELRKRNRRIEEVVQRVQRATEPIRSFDLYPKLKEDHKNGEKTAFGAAGARVFTSPLLSSVHCPAAFARVVCVFVSAAVVSVCLSEASFTAPFRCRHCCVSAPSLHTRRPPLSSWNSCSHFLHCRTLPAAAACVFERVHVCFWWGTATCHCRCLGVWNGTRRVLATPYVDGSVCVRQCPSLVPSSSSC